MWGSIAPRNATHKSPSQEYLQVLLLVLEPLLALDTRGQVALNLLPPGHELAVPLPVLLVLVPAEDGLVRRGCDDATDEVQGGEVSGSLSVLGR